MRGTMCDTSGCGVGTRTLGILSSLALSAVGLLMGSPVACAQDSGPREIREIASGWRFQVDVRDVGERERWYDADFDRSRWRAAEVPSAWDLFDEAMHGY